MAIDVNVPVVTNQMVNDLATMNANMEYIINSDGTAGRVLRHSRLNVAYNAGANSVQVYLENKWNGDDVDSSGSPHVITKGDSDTNWALNAGGNDLTIEAAGLTGNAVAIFAHITYNKTGDGIIYILPYVFSNSLYVTFYQGSASDSYDVTGLTSGEYVEVDILYLTDA